MLTRRNQNDVQIEVKKGAGKRTTTPQKVAKFVKWAWLITSVIGIMQEAINGDIGKGIAGAGVFAVFWIAVYCAFIWLYRKFQAGKQTYYDAVNFRDDIDQ